MNAGILYGAKDIRFGEAPSPQIGPDEILLESILIELRIR